MTLSQMFRELSDAYDRIATGYPLVRPTYNQFEVDYLPPYGDPEVSIPGELGTYVVVGVLVSLVLEFLDR